MMEWILNHLVQVIMAVFVLASLIKGIRQSSSNRESEPVAEVDDTEEQRRVREIQERIRRKIAERRGGPAVPTPQTRVPPPLTQQHPPPAPPQTFHEPVKRIRQELERKFETQLQPPHVPPANRAEMERQTRLADDLRAADETRLQRARRAAHQATEKAEAAEAPTALLAATRQRLLSDLRDPPSLRRAIMLREVIGPPVALR